MRLNVLYIDDEADLCENFKDDFASDKVTVETYTAAEKAVVAAKNNRPDVIFIDFRLPGTTGDQVASKMPDDVPKYLITGEVNVVTQFKFNGVISKPYDFEEVQRLIMNMLSMKEAS